MRRFIFSVLGILELAVAGLLVYLGLQIPSESEIEDTFQSAAQVTDHASEQVHLLRRQVEIVRRLEIQQLSSRLQNQTRAVTGVMRAQTVDFDAVRTMRDALGDIAAGLHELTETLDPAAAGKLSDGLKQVADLMDQKIIPYAERSAGGGNAVAPPADAERLREVSKALRQGRKGLDSTLARWPEMRDSLERMSSVLLSTKQQLDRAIDHRHDYETAMRQTVEVADKFVALLPLVSEQLDDQLDEEDRALADLGQGLAQVHGALPHYSQMTMHLLGIGQLLSWLIAAIVGLHGGYLITSVNRNGLPSGVRLGG
jgi:hypothetical protein